MPEHTEHADLKWAGQARSIPMPREEADILDMALSLVPELKVAALAVSRARQAGIEYPIANTEPIRGLVGKGLRAGGHSIMPDEIARFLLPGDFPIDTEPELLNVVYVTLNRCRQREALAAAIDQFDAALAPNPDEQGATE
jgi:hypothetical protein